MWVGIALPRASQIWLKSGCVAGQAIQRISSICRSHKMNSIWLRVVILWNESRAKLHPWKGKNRAPRSHPYNLHQSQCLFERHWGVWDHATWCLPRLANFHCHNGRFLRQRKVRSRFLASLHMEVRQKVWNQWLVWTGTHQWRER